MPKPRDAVLDPPEKAVARGTRATKPPGPAPRRDSGHDQANPPSDSVATADRPKWLKSKRKRDLILQSAAKLLSERGLAELTLADVAAEAGTFAGSIYYHFDSKDDLLEEVLNRGTTGVAELVMETVAKLPDGTTHRERIAVALRVHLSRMLLKDDFTVAYWRIIDQVPATVRERHLLKPRAYGAFWKTLFARAVHAGEIRGGVNPTIVRLMLLGSAVWALDWYDRDGPMTPHELADAMLEIIFNGVATPARVQPARG